MSDIALSVAWCSRGGPAGGLLLWMRRVARGREEELAAYCRARGYRWRCKKSRLRAGSRSKRTAGGSSAARRAVQNESSSGSSGWQCETEWVCEADNPLRQTFALQVASGTMDVGRLPEWLREGALRALAYGWGRRQPGFPA
jgi:hypothetical protein